MKDRQVICDVDKKQPVDQIGSPENSAQARRCIKQSPSRAQADEMFEKQVMAKVGLVDANDILYHFDSSREYNPWPFLKGAVNFSGSERNQILAICLGRRGRAFEIAPPRPNE